MAGCSSELLDGAPVVANVVATPATTTYSDGVIATRSSAQRPLRHRNGEHTGQSRPPGAPIGFRASQDAGRLLCPRRHDPTTGSQRAVRDCGDVQPWAAIPWQLTDRPDATQRVFGTRSGTPLITTLFFKPSSSADAREIAVAILPGDMPDQMTRLRAWREPYRLPPALDSSFLARATIARYTNPAAVALARSPSWRSTMEKSQTFRRSRASYTALQTRVKRESPLDSPSVGSRAYPALVGAIADRVFVVIEDGGLGGSTCVIRSVAVGR
jgi:hypothetical protein